MFSLIIIVVYFPLVFAHTLIIFSVNNSPFFSFPLTVLSSSFLLKYIPHHISPFPSPIISPSSLPLPPISLIVLSPHITPRLVLSSFPLLGQCPFCFHFFRFLFPFVSLHLLSFFIEIPVNLISLLVLSGVRLQLKPPCSQSIFTFTFIHFHFALHSQK